jgi:hypothetical protein
MPSTTMSAASGAADRRVAHRRVGAAAILAFLALLLAGAVRDAAGADPAIPASAPATTPATQPAQPQLQQQTPAPAQQTNPSFPREHNGGGRGFGGGGGSSAPDDNGGGSTPTPAAPSTTGGVIT